MEKNTMITLEDNTTYVLIDETEYEGKKYFFAIRIENETNNPTTDYEVFEEEIENNEVYMNTLEDSPLKQTILINFTNSYMKELNKETDEN